MNLTQMTFAGHSAIMLTNGSFTVAIDPWLQDNPSCPEELKNPDSIDLIVLTHGHPDHAGDVLRLGEKYNCKLIATFELGQALQEDGYNGDNLIMMNKGGTVVHEELRITLTHALHSNSYTGKNGTVYAGEACGTVIKASNHTFYHAGDTCLFSDMALIKETYRPDVAFFPMGDHFTMGPAEAARAAKLVGAKRNFPIHHSTFGLLTGTPQQFIEECKKLDIPAENLEAGKSLAV